MIYSSGTNFIVRTLAYFLLDILSSLHWWFCSVSYHISKLHVSEFLCTPLTFGNLATLQVYVYRYIQIHLHVCMYTQYCTIQYI